MKMWGPPLYSGQFMPEKKRHH